MNQNVLKFGHIFGPEFSDPGELRQFEPHTNENAILLKFKPFSVCPDNFKLVSSVVSEEL